MAEFLPNLDDGELWLPSDIFMNDVAANRYIRLTPRRYSSLDGLCRGFSALSLLPPGLYVGYSPPALGLSHKYFQVSPPLSFSVCMPFCLAPCA